MENGRDLPRLWRLGALELETGRFNSESEASEAGVRTLRDAIRDAWTEGGEPEAICRRLDAFAVRLRRARPWSAPLAARLRRLVTALPRGCEASVAEAEQILREAEEARTRLVSAAAPLFRPGARLLTYGYHPVVEALLREYGDRLEIVTVSEGRPGTEGVRTARALAEMALPVRLITEAQLEMVMRECDLALTAAERVLPDGGVIARVGTAVVARIAAAWRVPLYIVAESAAWVAEGDELARFHPECRPPQEVLPSPVPGVEVANVATDLTPPELIAGWVSDSGLSYRTARAA